MKNYQTPELVWQMVSADDILRTSPTSTEFSLDVGNDTKTTFAWWVK